MVGITMNTDAASAHEVLGFLRPAGATAMGRLRLVHGTLRAADAGGGAVDLARRGAPADPVSAVGGIGWALGFGLLALGIARWNGPLAASAATTFWLLQAPLDRGELFTGSRRRALSWGVGTAVVGGVLLGLATLSCPVEVLAGALVVIAVIVGVRRQSLLFRPL